MENIFGAIGEIIPIVAGIYCILYFGGYKSPKTKNNESLDKFENLKKKHGKKIILMGVFLILFGVFNLVKYMK